MILYFANREMEILGQASTNLPKGFRLKIDSKVEDVDTGVASFECAIGYRAENRLELEAMMNPGNYLLYSHEGEQKFYTIIDYDGDTKPQEILCYAEDAGLDLLNEIAGEFEATESHDAEWYINKYTNDSGFEIGINEIPSNSVRKLKWDGESTCTERLASIATQFGGYEISYSFEIEGMEVRKKLINIYKKRGKELEEQLRLNRDIDRIITKKSVANLATALSCTGGVPKGKNKPITLKGYVYDDGDFYVNSKGILCSREANAKWSRYVWNKEPNTKSTDAGYITKTYSYETVSQATLCAHAITELQKVCDMEVNYEVDIKKLPDDVQIGDRVNIVDDAGELYLSARILKLETSVVEDSYKATLGEYLIKDSGISQRVEDLATQFAELAANRTFYTWIAYADDETGAGISLNPAGKAYLGIAANREVEEVDISDPTIFKWSKIEGDPGQKGDQGDDGIGIAATYRYYILADSSLDPPAIDDVSVRPPKTGGIVWSLTEPSYIEGDSSGLYFVDCMVFSDDSIKYSAVSKSSSHGAAKVVADSIEQLHLVTDVTATTATIDAKVTRGGIDVTDKMPDHWFEWSERSEETGEDVPLLIDGVPAMGRSIQIDLATVSYGGKTIICDYNSPDGALTTNIGTVITTNAREPLEV